MYHMDLHVIDLVFNYIRYFPTGMASATASQSASSYRFQPSEIKTSRGPVTATLTTQRASVDSLLPG